MYEIISCWICHLHDTYKKLIPACFIFISLSFGWLLIQIRWKPQWWITIVSCFFFQSWVLFARKIKNGYGQKQLTIFILHDKNSNLPFQFWNRLHSISARIRGVFIFSIAFSIIAAKVLTDIVIISWRFSLFLEEKVSVLPSQPITLSTANCKKWHALCLHCSRFHYIHKYNVLM